MLRQLAAFGIIVVFFGCGTDFSYPKIASKKAKVSRHFLAADDPQSTSLPGSYIITFRTPRSSQSLRYASYLTEYSNNFSYLSERYLSDPRVKEIQFITSVDLTNSFSDKLSADDELKPIFPLHFTPVDESEAIEGSIARVDFMSEDAAREVLDEWDNAGAFWLAEPNYISHLSTESDGLFNSLANQYRDLNYWWLQRIKTAEAFQSIANRDQSSSVTDEEILNNRPIIAVLDSGVDYKHPALSANIWKNSPTDINLSSCENDLHGCNTTIATRGKLGNGDVHPFGTDGAGQSCRGSDSNCSHGTHVAGLIVGNISESSGAAGVCPICQIMILRIVGKVGAESGILDSSIIAAFKYVALFKRKGSSAVRIINASFGKFARSRTVGLLIRLMKNNRQAIVVAAAGNEDTMTMEYPAAFSDAIAVSAVDQQSRKESFSNFGRWVDISAPGSDLISTIPGGGVAAKSGTSMAAPLVAGVAGLMLARYPQINYNDLRKALLEGADPSLYRSDWAEGFNYQNYYPKIPDENLRQPLIGLGIINAEAALNKQSSTGLPVYSALDRVRPGCSTIGALSADLSKVFLTISFILPIFFSCLQLHCRVKNRPKSVG